MCWEKKNPIYSITILQIWKQTFPDKDIESIAIRCALKEILEEVMSKWWRHRLFLMLLSFTRKTNKYSWTRHHWEILEPREEAEAHPAPQRTKGNRGGYMLTSLLLPQAGAEPSCEVSQEPMVPPVGKESIGWISIFPSIVGHFLDTLTPLLSQSLQGNL